MWLALVAPAALFGQGDLATVTGVVTDSSKAVILGATVTIRNTETNLSNSITTNEDGYFTITQLPPGQYELTATKPGFNTYLESRLVLETGQQLRNDIELKIGAVSETVSVTAEVAPLNTQDGAIKGAVVVQQEIQDVPLDGRDFTDIAFLVPGVVPNAQGGAGSNMSVNGARGDNTGYRIDGFDDRNPRGAAAQLRPNIDALEEFKMETTGFSAQYGKMAGGIMNMVLKSGTNRLHGTLFEYVRNDMFDARSFFDPVKLPLHRNQYGGTLTGPLLLPKLYNGHNRTFFMLSFEGYHQTAGQTNLNNVPTAAERAGDFSQAVKATGAHIQIKDPLASNAAFPGGIIPPSRFHPVALKVLPYYPAPNYVGVGLNYQATETVTEDWQSILGKADHRFSSNDSLSVRYGYRWNPKTTPWAGTNLGGFGNMVHDNRSMGGVTYVHMFSPSLINELRAGVSRNAQKEHIDNSAGQPTAEQLGMGGSTTDPMAAGFPKMNITNYATVGFGAQQPVQYFVTDYQMGDVLTWIKGRHILKFGVDVSIDHFNQPFYNNQRGTFTANGVWTGAGTAANGDAFADFMLGLLNASTITQVPTRNYMRWTNWGAFVNDDFRITPTLTLNLGLRYEIDPTPHDKYDRWANFVPSLNKVIIASDKTLPNLSDLVKQGGLTDQQVGLARDYGLPNSLVFTNYKDFAPRFGFAWRPLGGHRTVLRGGYGWFYSGFVLNQMRQDMGTSFPFSTNLSLSRVAANPAALTLANPWPVAMATLAGTNAPQGFQVHAPHGYAQNYNLTLERDIGRGDVLEIGYVGSKGTHLGRQYDINLPVRSIAWYMPNGTNFPRPYNPWGTIKYYDFGSNSIYNAGQIMFRRRASGGLFYRLAYTYAKSIDGASQLTGASDGGYGGALDPRNLRLERGRSDFDRGHVFTAIFTYALPVGRGKFLLRDTGKAMNGMFGGWQLSGTITAYTGQPFTVEDSSISANLGQSDRPNRLAKGAYGTGTGKRGLDYPWYDPNAFVPTAECASRTNCSPDKYGFLPFAPGNSGRNILDGPGTFYVNTTLFKNFRLAERRSIQARAEVFNIFNHPNFVIPNRNYNETSAGIISDVQGAGRGGPRTMQFALKYIF
jgi:hypothetical protein